MSSHAAPVEEPGAPPHVHHMDAKTAYEACKFGMWLFLATEVLLFGGLFAAFALYRWMYLKEFHEASLELNRLLGATNTVVLLLSSFFAAIAVDAAQKGNNRRVAWYFITTIALGFVFLVIKYFEYSHKYHVGLFPDFGGPHGVEAARYKTFFGLYYCMTGLHGLHVIIGMLLMWWYGVRPALRNRFSARYYTPVEVTALYWHLVDLIWIYLFPLLYLVG
jgi:cytochrome c oxidase subunit 3